MILLSMFLNIRIAFWVCMGMPVAFMGGIALMPTIGITVNIISLFGFIFRSITRDLGVRSFAARRKIDITSRWAFARCKLKNRYCFYEWRLVFDRKDWLG